MRQKSNSILDSLKKLYVKITGKKVIKRKTEADVLSDIAEEYVPTEDIVKEYMSKVYEYKGSAATYSALPTEDVDTGDVYNVLDTGKNYAWTGTEWDNLGGASLIFTTDITQLTTPQLNELKAGDIVIKQTEAQNHTYIVTYQEYLHGICLTYIDASIVETVSYDYIDNAWVYNSTDVTSMPTLKAKQDKITVNPTLVGTEPNLEGLEIDGVKYKASGENKFIHLIRAIRNNDYKDFIMFLIINNDDTPITTSNINDKINEMLTNQNYTNIFGYGGSGNTTFGPVVRLKWNSSSNVMTIFSNTGSSSDIDLTANTITIEEEIF